MLEATVRLVPQPPERSLLVIGFPNAPTAADHVPVAMETDPVGLECFDRGIVRNLRTKGIQYAGMDDLPEGGAWLLAEYGGQTAEEAHQRASRGADRVPEMGGAQARLFDDAEQQARIWLVRRAAIGSTRIPGEHGGHATWEDAAVPPERLGDYLRDYLRLTADYGYHVALFGHFGQGCVHCRHDLDLVTAEGIENFRRYVEDAADLVVSYGGSLSGEHGDGQLRAAMLPRMFGTDLVQAFLEFKRIWDPELAMNPGKVVDPYRPDQNIRLGRSYNPRQVETHFAYTEDASFADAVNRCFGIGKCRHYSGGVMCPSFMVTGEEKHSTRGRARLLHEMMRDEDNRPGGERFWRDENVKEALDLCLSCKGCKSDCPVGVDMATYKAEFLSHYYSGRVRPRAGLRPRSPPGVGAAGRAPARAREHGHPRAAAEPRDQARRRHRGRAAGTRFAGQTFRDWFEERERRRDRGKGALPPPSGQNKQGTPVIIWPDTFTNFFSPEVGIAATEVLEAAGFATYIPDRVLCCGRPLYDYGMLPTAKRYLQRVLDDLREPIREGVPVVGLEPSCLATFREELPNLFPGDADAQRLSRQSLLLSELLRRDAPGFVPPLDRAAVVQAHCHHYAVMGFDGEHQLLEDMGLDVDWPDSGCCGLAGSFGYERGERYRVAQACGERAILPRVREAPKDTLVLADGFSCREQIAGNTHRRPVHLAQAMQLALRYGPDGPPGDYPERVSTGKEPRAGGKLAAVAAGRGSPLRAPACSHAAVRSRRQLHQEVRMSDDEPATGADILVERLIE